MPLSVCVMILWLSIIIFRHEDPHTDPDLQKQNFKDRFYGQNDPVAAKMLARVEGKEILPPADKSITTLWIGGLSPVAKEEDIKYITKK